MLGNCMLCLLESEIIAWLSFFFFFNDTATTEIYTLSLTTLFRSQVGRVPVYLLDTNCAENIPSDRDITHRLYGGEESPRVRQEMILGVGGLPAPRGPRGGPPGGAPDERPPAVPVFPLPCEHPPHGPPLP